MNENALGASVRDLVAIMQRLLGDGGCAWDRAQTLASLAPYCLEEAAEVVDAIESGDRAALKEELGDLLLQVVFQSELARAEGAFTMDDVVSGIVGKLVRRHPHVFEVEPESVVDGEKKTVTEQALNEQWERIKQEEKGKRPFFASIPRNLSALQRAHKMGTKVAKVGFDWPDPSGSLAKVHEELAELGAAVESTDQGQIREEFGDLLFAMVNYGRHLDISPEECLRSTCDKFGRRFSHVEQRAQEQFGGFGPKVGLAELDGFWNEAKALEKASTQAKEISHGR
jgi:MazG family protein